MARIDALVGEALAAGALGFSSSRTLRHKVPDGRYVPGTFAQRDELLAVAEALRRHGRGVFEVAPRFDGEGPSEPRVESELAWMREVSLRSERPLTFNLSQTRGQGEHWRLAIARAKEANAVGAQLRPQTSSRFIGVLTGIAHRTPFDAHPSWRRLRELPLAARLTALSDPRRRDSLIAEAKGDRAGLEASYVLNGPGGAARYLVPARARAGRDRGAARRLAGRGLHRPRARNRGTSAALALEDAVRRLSADTARTFGIEGRGVLREGTFADVNVIDFEALALPVPEYVHDFPHGAGRFRQGASGYEATIVNGQVFMQRGQHTGALAGRLLRS